jgi:hypothetical protein
VAVAVAAPRTNVQARWRRLSEIQASIDTEKGSYRDLCKPAVKAALVVGVGLAVLQQVTGIFTVFFCLRFVPETKGKQLEEIEAMFEQRVADKGPA